MDDQNERILKRRERIKSKNQMKISKTEEKIEEDRNSIPAIQIESNKKVVQKTQDSAIVMIKNIKVALEERIMQKQVQNSIETSKITEKVEQNRVIEADIFCEMSQKWNKMYKLTNASTIYTELMEQKEKCNQILGEKDRIINDIKNYLKSVDDHYVKNLEMQSRDHDVLMERIDDQNRRVRTVQREELLKLENTHNSRRIDILERHLDSYNKALEERKEYEDSYLEERLVVLEENDRRLSEIRENDNEEYIIVKEKLESDIHELQQKLQHVKAVFQLNQEKLEYNYQVLRKRDEENTIMKSKQKRRLTKAHDVLVSYRNKLKNQNKKFREENDSIRNDYRRVLEQIKDFQKMAKLIILSDERKIYDIWQSNYKDCYDRLLDIFHVADIFYSQQLGLEYAPPMDFINSIREITTPWNRRKRDPSIGVAEKIMKWENDSGDMALILEMLYANSDYLIEKRLSNVLKTKESSLIGIDAVLSVLNIRETDQIDHICKYIADYDKNKLMGEEGRAVLGEDSAIHPNYILEILKNYMQDQRRHLKNKLYAKSSLTGLLSEFDDAANTCWDMFTRAASDQEALWKDMIGTFEKYRSTLQRRIELTRANESVERQNCELRALLTEYYNSKINNLLQIPPPLTIQLNQ